MPSIFIWDSIFMGSGARLKPCLTNAEFWHTKNLFSSNQLKNGVPAKSNVDIVKSNCIAFSGIAGVKAVIIDNIVAYCDTFTLNYSLDNGVTWLVLTEASGVVNWFSKSGTTITVGSDSAYAPVLIGRYLSAYSGNDREVLDFTFAENNINEITNRAVEDDIVGFCFPMGECNPDAIMNPILPTSPI